MITRRKLATLFASAVGGLGLASGTKVMADVPRMPHVTQADLARYFRLLQHRHLLLPGLYEMRGADLHVLGRSFDIERPGLWSDALVVRSYNGHDRKEQAFSLPLEALEDPKRRGELWNEMKRTMLAPGTPDARDERDRKEAVEAMKIAKA